MNNPRHVMTTTRRPLRRRAAITIAVTAALVAGGSGLAYAYWTFAGSSTAPVPVASPGGTITATQGTISSSLIPDGASLALAGQFVNTTGSAATVQSIKGVITSITGAGSANGGCTPADYRLVVGGTDIASGATATGTVTSAALTASSTAQGAWSGISVRMYNDSSRNQNDCKGATVVITYTVS